MNSMWMSYPFAKFNRDDRTPNEALCPEAYILQEILKVNESMKKRNYSGKEEPQDDTDISSDNYTRTSIDENGHSNEGEFSDEAREMRVQVTSRSVSYLQGRNASSNYSVTEVHSKTTLKRTNNGQENLPEGKDPSMNEKRPGNRKNEVFSGNVKTDEKWENFDGPSERKSVKSASKIGKDEVLQNGVRNMGNVEEININDAVLGVPFELIEIYSSEKEKNSKNGYGKRSANVNGESSSTKTFAEENGEQYKLVSEENDFSKEEMNKFKEEICKLDNDTIGHLKEINERFRKNNSENTFVKSARYGQDEIINLKREKDCNGNGIMRSKDQNSLDKDFAPMIEKVESDNAVNLITIFQANGKVHTRKEDEESNEKNGFERAEKRKNSGKFNMKEIDTFLAYKIEEKHVSKVEKSNEQSRRNIDLTIPSRKPIENSDSRISKTIHHSKCDEFANENKQKEDVAMTEERNPEEKKKNVSSIVSSHGTSGTKKNNDSNGNVSTYSSKFNNSTNNTENTAKMNLTENVSPVIERENRRTNRESNDTNPVSHKLNTFDGGNTLKKSSVKSCDTKLSKITLKSGKSSVLLDSKCDLLKSSSVQQNKSSSGNKITIIIEKCENTNKEARVIDDDKNNSLRDNIQSSMINDENRKKQNSEDSCKDIKTIDKDGRDGEGKVENMNTCNVLTKIHERLTFDWQRMERLRMKLQYNVSPDAANWMMMLQLLDKTVARFLKVTVNRCKSYIHGSCDSHQAESEIAKLLTKYIIDLVKIVNKNKINLEDQERRVDQMQLESLRGRQIASKKRSILNEIIVTSNYWTNEISCLIETISSLVKNVMADVEEKENVREEKSPRKYKMIQRRVANNTSNDVKQKSGVIRSKNPKINLIKRESTVETQMSVASNTVNSLKQCKSKTSMKPLYTSRSTEKEKRQDDARSNVVEKKIVDNGRHGEKGKSGKKVTTNANPNQQKQLASRQKHRTSSNQQPVWRPGGSARIPSSSSATTWTQKSRPTIHTKENAKSSASKRGSSMDHIPTKKNYTNVEKIVDDGGKRMAKIHSCIMEEKSGQQDVSSVVIDPLPLHHKMADKKSNTSLKIAPETKLPRSRVYQKNCKDTSLCDVIDREVSKESKILRALEKIIKGAPGNEDERNDENPINSYEFHDETDSVSLEQPCLIEKEIKINEEEPTRDVDSKQFTRKLNSINEMNEKFPEISLEPAISKDFVPFSIGNNRTDDNCENFQRKTHTNFSSVTSASCTVNFTSNSDYISKQASFKHQASYNSISSSIVLHEEKQRSEKSKKNDVSQTRSFDSNEKQQKCDTENSRNLSTDKKEKAKVNFHAVSLNILKEFLCEQGIDVDLVNKAEKYLKDKRKTQKYLKKNSMSLADVLSNVENNQHLERNTKNECCLKNKIEKNTEKCKKNSTNPKKDLNEVSLQATLEMKDITTCTVRNSKDAYSQTGIHYEESKCLQTILEDDSSMMNSQAMETQTEMAEVKCVAIECCKNDLKNERRNASSMTMSLPVCNHSTETARIPCVSISVATDYSSSCNKENLSDNFTKNSNDFQNSFNNSSSKDNLHKSSSNISLKSRINDTEKSIDQVDQGSIVKFSHVLSRFLNQMHVECNKSSLNCEKDDETNELRYEESNFSTSSSQSSKHSTESESKVTNDSPVKRIPSVISAAFQVAAIKGRNLQRAMDIYERKMRSKFWKSKKEMKQRKKKTSKILKTGNLGLKSVYKSNSSVKIIMRKKNSDKYGIFEQLKVLRQAEIRSAFSETSFDLCNNSKKEMSDSAETSSTTVISSDTNFRRIEVKIPARSYSSVVLESTKPLIEFSVNEMEDVKFEGTEPVKKMSSNNMRLRVYENTNVQAENVKKFTLFSRENLLSLLYGIVCSIVFCCLQFTITCDVLS